MLRGISFGSRGCSRHLHTVPKLANDASKGIPGLFSAGAFKTAWTDHQGDLVARLNEATLETDNEARIPFHILLNTATKNDEAHVFNYASQSHNNHLFFASLLPGGAAEAPEVPAVSPVLAKRIEERYGGLEDLKQAFVEAADTLRGNGWVFLVERPDKQLAVLAAHNAGTPYHFGRQQRLDLNGSLSAGDVAELEKVQEAVASRKKNYNIALLALNLWQHAYVPDFGVGGRQSYVDQWWKTIDWAAVSSRLYRGVRT